MIEAAQALEQLLAGLGEAARFESVGQVPVVLPGLEVHGIGSIGVPVASADAKRIIAKARQAPYGRGESTIVDTDVRRVWQLDPSQFELRNAAWSAAVADVVNAIKGDLGIRGKVTAELYKLLVYEKGSFFKPHRDTEKIPGMFGTLVVCLPSRHEGGTLILEHDGQTKQIDFGGKDSEFQTRFVAFYADCRHEVRPVKSGYRVCLVYNLAGAGKKQPAAPHHFLRAYRREQTHHASNNADSLVGMTSPPCHRARESLCLRSGSCRKIAPGLRNHASDRALFDRFP